MKRNNKKIVKQWLVSLLSICMLLPSTGTLIAAQEPQINTDGICEHHPVHTPECGYKESVQGQPCLHVHDEKCGYLEPSAEIPCDQGCSSVDDKGNIIHQEDCSYQPATEGRPCLHVHDENCGYLEAVTGAPCTFICDICNSNDAFEIADFDILPDEIVKQKVPVGTSLESLHLPQQISVINQEGNVTVIPVTWRCESEFNGQLQGEYIFLPVLPEGCTVAKGINLPTIQIVVGHGISMLAEDTYLVNSVDEFQNALEEIKKANSEVAAIVLATNITLTTPFNGVEGKEIIISSNDGGRYLLTFAEEVLKLSGALTFENVLITPHTIYANGHSLVLGEGFGGGSDGIQRMTVYGGSDQSLTANTNITILDGVYKLIAGGNSSGTLIGDTHVTFGGNAKFPTAADGKQNGDYVSTQSKNYNLYLASKGEGKWNGPVFAGMDYEYGILPYGIYGGGTCGNLVGNTNITMTGGTVYQIFGGGAARRNPSHGQANSLEDLGRVSGNTSVQVTGGEVKSVYGGGYNDIFVFGSYEYDDSGVPENVRAERAVVSSDTYVEISGTAHVPSAEQNEDTSTSGSDCPAVYGGSFHSSVNNTRVLIGGNALIECGEGQSYGYGAVYGAGSNDIVKGTTFVELTDNAVIGNDQNKPGVSVVSQGSFSAITPLGRSSQSGCYLGGASFKDLPEIQNQNNEIYAAIAKVSGGKVDVLMASVKSRVASNQPIKTCNGNVQLVQSGGDVLAIEGGSVYSKNVVIKGNVDIFVTGGTTAEYILGRYGTSNLGHSVIEGDCTLTFSNCGNADEYRMSPLIWAMDDVYVSDNAHVAVFGEHTMFDSNKKPFTPPLHEVKNLTIEAGSTLAFKQDAKISGDFTINGALHMARMKKTISIGGTQIPVGEPKAVTLTAGGTAVQNGYLLPIQEPKTGANYGEYFEPVVNEEYVYAQTENSNMELTLKQGADKFFVDRKNKKAGQDVWFINANPVETITGDLIISKVVTGNAAEPNRDFNFTVSLSDQTIDGTYGNLEFINGVANFTLKHNESKTASGLPVNVTYQVAETEANQDGYTTTSVGEKGTIVEGEVAASFTNTKNNTNPGPNPSDKTGNLKVSKVVTGNAAELNRDFNFTVSLNDQKINGTYGDVEFTNGVANFTLKHNESKTASGLPANVTYQVVETEANQDGYTTTSVGEKGTIVEGEVAASFTNAKNNTNPGPNPSDKTGNLKVSKTVTGNKGDQNYSFAFKVTLDDTSIDRQYGDLMFHDGVAIFTLKHGESKMATKLPAGIRYTVEECDNSGYTVTKSGDVGTIEADVTATASFNNHKSDNAPAPNPDDSNKPTNPPTDSNQQNGSNKPSKPNEPTNKVPTGKQMNLMLSLILLVLSAMGIVITWYQIRQRYE